MNEEILKDLRDIHWPPPPSIWPFAPGIYVILLLAVALGFLLYYFFIGQKRRRLRKEIMREFLIIESLYLEGGDIARLQASLGALLRRMVFFRSTDLSRASDLEQMSSALIKMLPQKEKTMQLIELLTIDRFQKNPMVDGTLLLNLAREQLKRCRI